MCCYAYIRAAREAGLCYPLPLSLSFSIFFFFSLLSIVVAFCLDIAFSAHTHVCDHSYDRKYFTHTCATGTLARRQMKSCLPVLACGQTQRHAFGSASSFVMHLT